MPKRTNDFQELVSLVQKALAPVGAKISDSPLVDVPGMSEPREIDVLIESDVGPYHIKIAVEAKDQGRKLDSTQFESIVGKYFLEGGVKVNKVVIITHNGFYQPVIDRAKQSGVDLFTLREAKEIRWQNLSPIVPFKTAPKICDIEILPTIADVPPETILRDGRISCSHGTNFGTPEQFAFFLLRTNVFRNQEAKLREIDDLAAQSPDGKKGHVEFKPDHLHTISVTGQEYVLEKFSFYVHFSKAHFIPQTMTSELRFQMAPHVCSINVVPEIVSATAKELSTEGRVICTCCGKDHGMLNEVANRLIFQHLFPKQPEVVEQFKTKLAESPNGQAMLNLTWQCGPNRVVRFRDCDYPVTAINIGVHAVSATAPLVCKHYQLQTPDGEARTLSHLQAIAGGKTFNVVMPHVEGGHAEKIVLKIDSTSPFPPAG